MQQRHLLLDPARGEEKSSEIRQHDGVMTDAVDVVAGLRRAALRWEYEVRREGERRQGSGAAALSPPTYI